MVYEKNENGSYSNISAPKKGGIIHAIGEIYIQYPGEADPNTLFPNMTWQNVSSNYAGAFFRTREGAFFRAEGGNAQSFNCTNYQPFTTSCCNFQVGSSSRNGAHTHNGSGDSYYYAAQGGGGSVGYALIDYVSYWCSPVMVSRSCYSQYISTACTSSPLWHVHTGCICAHGTETRPMNYTIRIWKRIA